MNYWKLAVAGFFMLTTIGAYTLTEPDTTLKRIPYVDKSQVVDLGVGLWAWPMPMDYDGDGDLDMIVSCPDVPYRGIYLFENKQGGEFPTFEAPIRISDYLKNPQVSYIDGKAIITDGGYQYTNFQTAGLSEKQLLFATDSLHVDFKKKPRFTQYRIVDFDGDGDQDIMVGIDDWTEYGWDNAFNKEGVWTNGPLRGYVYFFENKDGKYTNKGRVEAGGKILDVYGAPSPNFADFDGDGDLDIICGEFVDTFTWFENVGTRTAPRYAEGRKLSNAKGIIKMDLEMIIPVALDWNNDGHTDLIVGDEDGRVAYMKNTGKVKNNMPVFEEPRYFQQKAGDVKFGALATPFSVDWDDDGDTDLIVGNSAGYIAFIENTVPDGQLPAFKKPRLLTVGKDPIRIQAGENGSIQGPCESKWGYTTLTVADWDGDGKKDIIYNSIWGKIEWFKNIGTNKKPKLAPAQPVTVAWEGATPKPEWNWWDPKGKELVTQWRTTPYAVDWNKDGLVDLIMLDHEGYLAYFERFKDGNVFNLKPGKRIFYIDQESTPFHLADRKYGGSGRKKFTWTDWDGDGDLDLILNSRSANWFENVSSKDGRVTLVNRGPVSTTILAGHTTSPTTFNLDNKGKVDLIIGAEDGFLYYMKR